MQVIQMLVPQTKWGIKCPYPMNPSEICIHNTANKASARAEISYMIGNNNEVSYHYAIDDIEVIQGLPLNRNGWHAGDGANGRGNRNAIAIEICYSTGDINKFMASERKTAEFTAELLKAYGWGIDKVKKHKDYSGKYCPHKTLDMGWERFRALVAGFSKGAVPAPQPPQSGRAYRAKLLGGTYLETVYKADDTANGYAGIFGKPIDGIQVWNARYRVHTIGKGWLPWVNKVDGTNEGYAGWYGFAIDGIQVEGCTYQAHTRESGWLSKVSKTDGTADGYAGIFGQAIDGFRIF